MLDKQIHVMKFNSKFLRFFFVRIIYQNINSIHKTRSILEIIYLLMVVFQSNSLLIQHKPQNVQSAFLCFLHSFRFFNLKVISIDINDKFICFNCLVFWSFCMSRPKSICTESSDCAFLVGLSVA